MPPMYDLEQVRPMWEELTNVGLKALTTQAGVESVLGKSEGTVLCVVNSVCGCAAGNARPGVGLALQGEVIPDELVTVFAGVDQEAVASARGYMSEVQPSSPCIALFENGKAVHILERRHIERMTAVDIANDLSKAFQAHCSRKGPSVPREVFENNDSANRCGSSLDPYQGG